MQLNEKKVKMFLVLAIVLIVVLLAVSVFQLVSLNQKRAEIIKQEQQIAELNNQLNYYKNSNPKNNNGSEITAGGEE